jgi:hypothetical protein
VLSVGSHGACLLGNFSSVSRARQRGEQRQSLLDCYSGGNTNPVYSLVYILWMVMSTVEYTQVRSDLV